MRNLGQLVIRLREIVERMKEDAAAISVTVCACWIREGCVS